MSYRGLVVAPAAAALVEAGGRDIPIRLAQPAEVLEAGRPLRLVSQAGRALGLALADPENERLRVLAGPDEAVDADRPRALRIPGGERARPAPALGLTGERAAYRALHGAGDGLPGFTADVLAPWAVLYVHSRAFLAYGQALAEALVAPGRGCAAVSSRSASRRSCTRRGGSPSSWTTAPAPAASWAPGSR